MRKDIMEKEQLYYNSSFKHSQDYDLWVRASKKQILANIPEILLFYRVHNSTSNHDIQRKAADQIRRKQLVNIGIHPTKKEIKLHNKISNHEIISNIDFFRSSYIWICKLKYFNKKNRIYSEGALNKNLAEKWYYICSKATKSGFGTWKLFWQLPFSDLRLISIKRIIKFILIYILFFLKKCIKK